VYTTALWQKSFNPKEIQVVKMPDKEFNGVVQVQKVTEYEDANLETLVVLAVELEPNKDLTKQRAYQRGVISFILERSRDWNKAVVAFYTKGELNWRLSYIKINEEENINLVTPLYRWSFLVGVGEPCNTIKKSSEDLIKAYKNKEVLVEDIEPVFTSLNAVTDEFYTTFLKSYDTIKESLFYISTNKVEQDLKKVMGQTMALFFLQKKGFLGVEKGKEWGLGDKNYLNKLLKYEGSTIYKDILKPLFSDLAGDEPRNDTTLPILNGGLFEVIDAIEDENFELPTEEFQAFVYNLSTFNFTVLESDPYDREVAVDPEMLGKIYQHILWRDEEEGNRKKKGVAYTPSDIVTFISKDSISNWLVKKLNNQVPKEDLDELIDLQELNYDLLTAKGSDMKKRVFSLKSINYLERIDYLLKNIKILEPAVGSGGFLVGILTEIAKIRKNLGILLYFIGESNKKEFDSYTDYSLKLHTISHSLYGVDLFDGAVDIAKLRIWLSLLVDMKHPKQLPNLDFKIVVGNSVVDRVSSSLLISDITDDTLQKSLTKIETLKQEYTNKEHNKKTPLKKEIVETMLQSLSQLKGNGQSASFSILNRDGSLKRLVEMKTQSDLESLSKRVFSYDFAFSEVMRQGGFDIVIGNPPYVKGSSIGDAKEELQQKFKTYHGSADLLIYFYEQGYNLLREDGVLAYITSNKWLTSKYGEHLRSFLLDNTELLLVVDFKRNQVFRNIGVDTEITIFRKSKPTKDTGFVYCKSDKYILQD
jgi:hypothetical protein